MTRHEITKAIVLYTYGFGLEGIQISYRYHDRTKGENRLEHLFLSLEQSLSALKQLGEIENFEIWPETNNIKGKIEIVKESGDILEWPEFLASLIFSQWDALNIVINHEFEKAIGKDVNQIDIRKPISNMLKK